jgi:hypothetical protein
MLPWLLSIVREWSQEEKNKFLLEAGSANGIAALQLMLHEGAEWPSSFFGEQSVDAEFARYSWHFRAVAWAISKGYGWGMWRYQHYAAELYTEEYNRQNAEDLFEWAHENGCPCTCEVAGGDAQ